MKLIILLCSIIFTTTLPATTCFSAEKNILFKNYYLGMSIDDAKKIAPLTLKQELAEGKVKDFYSGETELVGKYWTVTLSFTKNKLSCVELLLNSNDRDLPIQINEKLKQDGFFVPLFFTRDMAYDVIKILNKDDSKRTQDRIISEIKKSRMDRYFLCVYIDKHAFDTNKNNKKSDITGIKAIFGNYPNSKRLVVFSNIGSSYEVVFGTKEAAYVYTTSYISVADEMASMGSNHQEQRQGQPQNKEKTKTDKPLGEKLGEYQYRVETLLN